MNLELSADDWVIDSSGGGGDDGDGASSASGTQLNVAINKYPGEKKTRMYEKIRSFRNRTHAIVFGKSQFVWNAFNRRFNF